MSEERLNHYKEWIEDNEEIVVDSSIFEELVKEIERLNNIIKNIEKERCNLHNANGLLENAIDTLRKRNEEIYEGFMATQEELKEYAEENERLNNIIETFEEELERESNIKEENTCLEHNTFIDIRNTLKTVLKRLQELKGENNDKENN